MPLLSQDIPGERYLIIAVDRVMKKSGKPNHTAMLIKGVFTLKECEKWLRAYPFHKLVPGSSVPDYDVFFKSGKVLTRSICASSTCGTIEPTWWGPFKEEFGQEFGNLKFADAYSWQIWHHFLESGAGAEADTTFTSPIDGSSGRCGSYVFTQVGPDSADYIGTVVKP